MGQSDVLVGSNGDAVRSGFDSCGSLCKRPFDVRGERTLHYIRCREQRSVDAVCESPASLWLTASTSVLFLLALLTIFCIVCHVL